MVSIITPVYNRVQLFRETCKSILAQSYSDLEFIVVDDGSEEDLKGMLDELKDPRIKYFRLPHIGKLSVLRNFGIANSSGEFIIFVDSDDLLKANALEVMVQVLKKDHDLGFVVADCEIFRGERTEYDSIYKGRHKMAEGKRFYKELFDEKDFVFFGSGLMFRRSCLDRNGSFDEALTYGDKNFFARLAFHFNAKITDEVLVRIRKHDQNVTAMQGPNSPAAMSFIEEIYTLDHFFMKNYIDPSFHKRMSAIYNFKLAEYYYRNKLFSESKKTYSLCLKHDPLNWKAIIRRFLSGIRK